MTKPATSLPWDVQDDTEICSETGGVATTHAAESSVGTRTEYEDAAYIVTACNTYPSLVEDNKRLKEALRELLNAVNPMPGKGVGMLDGDKFVDQARALLAEIERRGA